MLNPSPPLNLENLLSTEVKETRNQNNEIDWMKVCVPLPSKSLAVQIVSLKRDVVRDFMALSYVGISDEKCKGKKQNIFHSTSFLVIIVLINYKLD